MYGDPRPVGLVLLVLLSAGCAGFGGDLTGRSADTVTPAPVPENATAYPPGIGPEGVLNPRVLGEAHGDALNGTGYVLTANRTVRYPNGTLYSRLRVRVELAPNRTHSVRISTRGPGAPVLLGRPPASATFWSDGDRFLRRLERDDRTIYNEYTPPDSYAGTWRYWVQDVALDGRPADDVTQTVGAFRTRTVGATRDGTVTVGGTELRDDRVGDELVTDTANASLVARVEPDGLVRFYRVTYRTDTPDETTVHVTRTVRVEAVGNTTVGRPAWYDRAVGSDVGPAGTDSVRSTPTAPP